MRRPGDTGWTAVGVAVAAVAVVCCAGFPILAGVLSGITAGAVAGAGGGIAVMVAVVAIGLLRRRRAPSAADRKAGRP